MRETRGSDAARQRGAFLLPVGPGAVVLAPSRHPAEAGVPAGTPPLARFCSRTPWAAPAKVGTPWNAAFLREGVAARAGQHAVGESLLASLGGRDQRGGAESQCAPATADDEPLDAALSLGRLDE